MKLPPANIVNEGFWEKMKSRMKTSWYKYGNVENNYPDKVDALKTMQERVKLYQETGNTEWLVDAANQLMIEFTYPSHPKAHFRATDSEESPGLRARREASP